jgi:uncharacterized protein with von Willebrand factor type A (vWA) domain
LKKYLDATDRNKLNDYVINYGNPSYFKVLMMDILPPEGVTIRASAEASTAFHMYDARKKQHIIYLGTNHEEIDGLETKKDIIDYSLSLTIHELGHAHYTTRDRDAMQQRLKETGIPFALLNLAEDARIEKLMKDLTKKMGGGELFFDWERWLKTPEGKADMSAEAILFAIINTEDTKPIYAPKANRVSEYYVRFISAKDTFEVIDILVEWRDEFHPKEKNNKKNEEEQQQQQSQSMQNSLQNLENAITEINPRRGNGDNPALRNLEDMANSMMSQEEIENLIDELESSSMSVEDGHKPEADKQAPAQDKGKNNTIMECSNTDTIFNQNGKKGEIFVDEYNDIMTNLKKMKQESKKTIETREPSREINARRLGLIKNNPNTTKLYKKKVVESNKKGKSILLVLDLSGSMNGAPIDAQRTIALACNELARKNKRLAIDMMGSKTMGGKSLYQVVTLPSNSDALMSISAGGNEGIAYALQKNTSLLKKKDAIVFITDGHLDSKEISKEHIGKYLSPKTKTIGLYVGREKSFNEDMKEWFDYTINATSVSAAVEQMVSVIEKGTCLYKKESPQTEANCSIKR